VAAPKLVVVVEAEGAWLVEVVVEFVVGLDAFLPPGNMTTNTTTAAITMMRNAAKAERRLPARFCRWRRFRSLGVRYGGNGGRSGFMIN